MIACANCGLWACICVEGIWLCLSCAYARRMRAVPRFLTVEDLSRAKDFPTSRIGDCEDSQAKVRA